MKTGTLYGVSVGTGDPELITVKGLKILQRSKVIAFPAGRNDCPGVAQNIIEPWLQPQQQLLPLEFPYTQNSDVLRAAWKKAGAEVWQYLSKGTDIAFACLGDVNFYSTFTYLAQALRQQHLGVSIKTIPGVCSPMAIASELQIPLTVNHERLAVLPALHTVKELELALSWAEVVVLMKFSSVYQQVWQILAQHNLLSSSYIIEKATFPEQKIYEDLANQPELNLSYFSIMVIKKFHNSHN